MITTARKRPWLTLKLAHPGTHATRIGNSEQGPVAMWAGDGGYEANDVTLPGPRHRLEMFPDGYRYVDTLEQDTPEQDAETLRP